MVERKILMTMLLIVITFSVLLIVPVVPPLTMPSVSAIGCAPIFFSIQGPYQSSLQGVVSFSGGTADGIVKHVTVEPGTSVNMTFGVFFPDDLMNRTIILDFVFHLENASNAHWLQASYSPNPIRMERFQERANFTVTLNIAEDAPFGEQGIIFRGTIPGAGDCWYGDNGITLEVSAENQPTTIATTITRITNTVTSTDTVTTTMSITSYVTQTTNLTSTTTVTTERNTDPSTYVWAIGATVTTIVLAVILILRKRNGN